MNFPFSIVHKTDCENFIIIEYIRSERNLRSFRIETKNAITQSFTLTSPFCSSRILLNFFYFIFLFIIFDGKSLTFVWNTPRWQFCRAISPGFEACLEIKDQKSFHENDLLAFSQNGIECSFGIMRKTAWFMLKRPK